MKRVMAALMAMCASMVAHAEELTGEIDLAAEGAALAYAQGITGDATITNSSSSVIILTIDVPEGVAASFTGTIHGNIKIVKTGAGLQKFAAGSTYKGGTDILAGTVSISERSCLGDGDYKTGKGTVTIDGATLQINGELDYFAMTRYRIQVKNGGVIDIVKDAKMGIASTAILRTAGETFIKRGAGTLRLNAETSSCVENVSASTWIIEEGAFDTASAQAPFGDYSAQSGLAIQINPGAKMWMRRFGVLPKIILNGGTLMRESTSPVDVISTGTGTATSAASFKEACASGATNTPIDVVNLHTNRTWLLGRVRVTHFQDAPVIFDSPYTQVSLANESSFEVDDGAELHIGTELFSGTNEDGGFVKRGKGTLKLLKPCNFSGTVMVEEGELVISKNAWLDAGVKFKTSQQGKIKLEDGSYVSVGSDVDSLLASADVWIDATQIAGAPGEVVRYVQNLGTCGGNFSTVTNGTKRPTHPTLAANAINGKPALSFDGTQGLVLDRYTNQTANLTVFIVNQWNAWEHEAGKGLHSSPFSFSTVNMPSDKVDNSTKGSLIYLRNGTSLSQLTVSFGNGASSGKRGTMDTGLENQKPTITMTKSTNGSAHVWSYINEETEPATMSFTSITLFDIDLVAIGGRLDDHGAMQYYGGGGDRMFNGYLGEMIVFTRPLAAGEIEYVKAYLRNKWFGAEVPLEAPDVAVANVGRVLNLNVAEGARAAVDVGAWSGDNASMRVVKSGAGDLSFANKAAGSAVHVEVNEGRLLLDDESLGVEADLWMDAADSSVVTLDEAASRVVSVRNKGRAGGVFAQSPQEKAQVPCPPYSANGLNGKPCLDFDYQSALTTMAYTNKGSRTIHIYTVLRKEDMDEAGAAGGVWTSPFGMGFKDQTGLDFGEDGTLGVFHDKTNLGLNKYIWKSGQVYAYTFNRAWTNEAYIMVLHLDGNCGVYTEILESDEDLNLPVCATYNATTPPNLNIDVTVLGGRIGRYGYPAISKAVAEGNRMWKGKMGEFIVFTQKPSQEQETALLDYLRRKWFKREDAAPPRCLVGNAPRAVKTTAKTTLALAGGTTLAHAVDAQNLARLTAEGGVTWEKTSANDNSTFFTVAGDVNFAAGQRVWVDTLPKDSTTLFTYGTTCAFGDWVVLGDGAEKTKVFHRAGEKRLVLQRNRGMMIIIR